MNILHKLPPFKNIIINHFYRAGQNYECDRPSLNVSVIVIIMLGNVSANMSQRSKVCRITLWYVVSEHIRRKSAIEGFNDQF